MYICNNLYIDNRSENTNSLPCALYSSGNASGIDWNRVLHRSSIPPFKGIAPVFRSSEMGELKLISLLYYPAARKHLRSLESKLCMQKASCTQNEGAEAAEFFLPTSERWSWVEVIRVESAGFPCIFLESWAFGRGVPCLYPASVSTECSLLCASFMEKQHANAVRASFACTKENHWRSRSDIP